MSQQDSDDIGAAIRATGYSPDEAATAISDAMRTIADRGPRWPAEITIEPITLDDGTNTVTLRTTFTRKEQPHD